MRDLRAGGHQKLLNLKEKSRFFGNAALRCYRSSLLSLIATAVANTEVSQVMQKEDLGVDTVHGWFTDEGDSILSAFMAAFIKEATRRLPVANFWVIPDQRLT